MGNRRVNTTCLFIALLPGALALAAEPDAAPAWEAYQTQGKMVCQGRVCWPADKPEPVWVRVSHLHLVQSEIRLVGSELRLSATLWTSADMDARRCVLEVIWDSSARKGVRLGVPREVLDSESGTREARWSGRLGFCPGLVDLWSRWGVPTPGDPVPQ